MSWLRSSPLRQSFSRGRAVVSDMADVKAVNDSFCGHWQQAFELIGRAEVSKHIFNPFKQLQLPKKK